MHREWLDDSLNRILALAFETTLFALTLIKFAAWVMTHGHLGRQSILRVLVRDGTWAYAVIFCSFIYPSHNTRNALITHRRTGVERCYVSNEERRSRICNLPVSQCSAFAMLVFDIGTSWVLAVISFTVSLCTYLYSMLYTHGWIH